MIHFCQKGVAVCHADPLHTLSMHVVYVVSEAAVVPGPFCCTFDMVSVYL